MARASGKVILLGEHAVVYGAPAIAAGIERGATAIAARATNSQLRLGSMSVSPDDDTELGRAFLALLRSLDAPACEIELVLDVPAGCGLGASAAIGVAVARAILELSSPCDTPEIGSKQAEAPAMSELVQTAALAWERVFHGNPSGVDTTAALSGGCIYYTRDSGAVRLRVRRELSLAVAVAGPAASTRSMVESVARLRDRRPDIVTKTIDGIAVLVRNARLCIEAGDLPGLGKLMDLNQMLLAGLFVSTEAIEDACRMARDAGALGAKLTGAGGGGAVLALADGDPARIVRTWQDAGLEAFVTRIPPHAEH